MDLKNAFRVYKGIAHPSGFSLAMTRDGPVPKPVLNHVALQATQKPPRCPHPHNPNSLPAGLCLATCWQWPDAVARSSAMLALHSHSQMKGSSAYSAHP
jgi:hypothetical protein